MHSPAKIPDRSDGSLPNGKRQALPDRSTSRRTSPIPPPHQIHRRSSSSSPANRKVLLPKCSSEHNLPSWQDALHRSMSKSTMDSSVLPHLDVSRNDAETERRFARMLVTVTVVGSLHAVRVVVSSDATVKDVILAALTAYAKEGRLPLHGCDAEAYTLHFSQFSLQSLNPRDLMKYLGARSFVLCPMKQQNPPACDPKVENWSLFRMTKSWWNVLGIV